MKRLKKKMKYSKKKVKFRKSLSKKRIKKKKISKRRGGSANNADIELKKKRDSNFIISHITRLQQFYNKDTIGIRSKCNFECSEKDKFKRILFPNNSEPYKDLGGAKIEDIVKRYWCLNHEDGAKITDRQYFKTLETEGRPYFREKYKAYFNGSLPINDPEWIDIVSKVKDKMKPNSEKIVLVPAELLGIFTENGNFKALSHPDWTSNLNFNYMLHVLYQYGEIILIIPKFNSVLPCIL